MTFTVLAQSFTTTQRITKTVKAINETAALRSVASELDAAGFYAISVTRA